MSSPSIFRRGLFNGQVFLISGGGTGIGRAIACELAYLGATVVLCSRSLEHLEATRDEIEATGGIAVALACNIRHQEQVQATIQAVLDRFGRLDGLVNNAGGQFLAPAETI